MYTVSGDTIRLNANFVTFAGVAANPDVLTLNIYDELRNVVASATSTSGITDDAVGSWYYDYTTVNEGVHFYEFIGTLEGYSISNTGTFYVTWA
jgi:hypothetical protein